MRSDLNKLLCERERLNHRAKYHTVRKKKLFKSLDGEDEMGSTESMKFRHTRVDDTKSFNENLKPLFGAVQKAVGRPWNKFYSELCEVFDKRSVVNQHILDHLKDYVVTNTFMEDEQLMYMDQWGRTESMKGSRFKFYVHPKTGILLKNTQLETRKQRLRRLAAKAEEQRDKVFRKIDEYNILQKIGDVWFHFELKDLPDRKIIGYSEIEGMNIKTPIWNCPAPVDVFGFKGSDYYRSGYHTNQYVSHTKYHYKKQSASKKMLKKYNIING